MYGRVQYRMQYGPLEGQLLIIYTSSCACCMMQAFGESEKWSLGKRSVHVLVEPKCIDIHTIVEQSDDR